MSYINIRIFREYEMKKIPLLFILSSIFIYCQSGAQPTEKGFDWLTLLIALLGIAGTFSAGYFTNKWNSKSQEEHYLRTINYELKKERIINIENAVSEFIGVLAKIDGISSTNIKFNLELSEPEINDTLSEINELRYKMEMTKQNYFH